MNPDLRAYLADLAKQELASDIPDFDPQQWSGGNFDDAYSLGITGGYTMLARQLLFKYPE